MNFPQNPTNGQVYTIASRSWTWDSSQTAWTKNSIGSTGPAGPTGPAGALLQSLNSYSFVADGVTSDYIIQETPTSINNLLVSLDGLLQTPNTNFLLVNVSGGNATVRFTSVPTYQATIDIVHLNTGSAIPGPTGPTGTGYWTNSNNNLVYNSGNVLIGYSSSYGNYPLQVNGQIAAASGGVMVLSDSQYKWDVNTLNNGLNLIKRLDPVSYKFLPNEQRNLPQGTQIGFVAQQVQDALGDELWSHNVVKTTDNGDVMLDQSHLIPLLVRAVQELSEQVEQLKSQLNIKHK